MCNHDNKVAIQNDKPRRDKDGWVYDLIYFCPGCSQYLRELKEGCPGCWMYPSEQKEGSSP